MFRKLVAITLLLHQDVCYPHRALFPASDGTEPRDVPYDRWDWDSRVLAFCYYNSPSQHLSGIIIDSSGLQLLGAL